MNVEIAVEGLVDAPAESVVAFLSDLDKHWLLSDRFIELVSLETQGGGHQRGTIRLQGPLGLHRTASTRMLGVSPPDQLVGRAEVGRRTRALIRWTLSPRGTRTAVGLSATVVTLALPDRLLLAAGGARWLRTRFAATIARLALQLGRSRGSASDAMPCPAPNPGTAGRAAPPPCRGFPDSGDVPAISVTALGRRGSSAAACRPAAGASR
jgi:hypothetical protein